MPLLQIGKKKATPQLKDKIYFSFSSEGFGHSSRALAIASQLPKDQVLMGSYSYSLERVMGMGYAGVEVPQEVKFIGAKGTFDVGKTIFHNQALALGFNQIIQDEADIIEANNISLVVADGRMAPVLAAERLDIPCVVVTNQSAFYPFFERDSAFVKMLGRSFDFVMKLWLSSAEEILIPDFPPPDTVCLPNLSDNYQVKKRTRFVGPLVAWQADDIKPLELSASGRPLIVVGLGGHSYRKPLFDEVLRVAKLMPDLQFELLTSFTASDVPTNVNLQPIVSDAAPYFKAAKLVITQGGHSTAMELLTLGKPSLVVPDAKQIEQENNASRLVELGVSRKLLYDDLNERNLKKTIESMLSDSKYQKSADVLAQKAREIHGAAQAADVLREYAHRLSAY